MEKKVLQHTPDDVLTLDKVSQALVSLGGRENAEKALKYARAFEDIIDGMAPPEGKDAPQIQEERDRAAARTLSDASLCPRDPWRQGREPKIHRVVPIRCSPARKRLAPRLKVC